MKKVIENCQINNDRTLAYVKRVASGPTIRAHSGILQTN